MVAISNDDRARTYYHPHHYAPILAPAIGCARRMLAEAVVRGCRDRGTLRVLVVRFADASGMWQLQPPAAVTLEMRRCRAQDFGEARDESGRG